MAGGGLTSFTPVFSFFKPFSISPPFFPFSNAVSSKLAVPSSACLRFAFAISTADCFSLRAGTMPSRNQLMGFSDALSEES
jgi:hypothetical protein